MNKLLSDTMFDNWFVQRPVVLIILTLLQSFHFAKKIYLQYLFWWLSPEQITTIQFSKYVAGFQLKN
jgi:hypothetical protein